MALITSSACEQQTKWMIMIETYQAKLDPYSTQLSIEVLLEDTANIITPNYVGDFYFTFAPATTGDHQRLAEMGEQSLMEYVRYSDPWDKEPKPCWELNNGLFYCKQPKQFCAPKLNLEDERFIKMYNQASLKVHFHDTKDGRIYLTCDYCDVYMEDYEQQDRERREYWDSVTPSDDDIEFWLTVHGGWR